MQFTDEALAMLKRHEGVRHKAYRDPIGIWTIGVGHTSMAGPPKVVPGMKLTDAEVDEILRRDLKKFEDHVRKRVKVPLNDNQFSALVSFCFNVGPGNFDKSSVLRYVNAGRFDGVPARLALWNKAGGRVFRGLVKRRAEEGELFMRPVENEPELPEAMPREVEKTTGKPAAKSTTIWAQIAQWLAAGGATVLSTIGGMDWKVAAILGGVVIIGAGLWIIRERLLKSQNEGV